MRPFRQSAPCVVVALILAAPVAAQEAAWAPHELARLLARDVSAPTVVVRHVASRRDGDVIIDDVSFPSISGGPPIEAYIVRPTTPATGLAGVLFVHWFGPPAPTSNRTQFLDEAKTLARRGTVSLRARV